MYLIIETATSRGLVALCEGHSVRAMHELALGLTNSRLLEPALEGLLQQASCSMRELQYVAVGHGPGSYTGLRVGVASAKAIAIACNIPLVGISSLKGFVPPADYEGPFISAIDAKIGGVYAIKGHKTKEAVTFLGSESLEPIERFIQQAKEVGCIVTPDWQPLKARALDVPKVFETSPSLHQLCLEAEEKFKNKLYTMDGTLPLLYLRPTQAEMEKLRNKPSIQ